MVLFKKVIWAEVDLAQKETETETMTSSELPDSWKTVIQSVKDARSLLSKVAHDTCQETIFWVDEYLEHNEFGLAVEMLEFIVTKTGVESEACQKLIADALALMKAGRLTRVARDVKGIEC